MEYLLSALVLLPHLLLMGPLVHIYQLESYQAPGYIRSVRQNAGALYGRLLIPWALPMALGVLAAGLGLPAWAAYLITAGCSALAGALSFRAWRKQPAKKPLVFTARVKRLYGALALVELALAALALLLPGGAIRLALGQTAGVLLLPAWVLLGGLLALPVENAFKAWYYHDAARRLAAREDVIKIGITGSYGKTSSKVILGTLLSERYNTLITPASYNTPMGVTRVIRGQLEEKTQVFVAEMGARHVGDIAEMCRLVRPTYGLITSVGPQHLETFHTIERVAATKYELVEALPPEGMAFFPSDNEICRELYARTSRVPAALFGFSGENLAMTARDLRVGSQGCTFTLIDAGGEARECTTRLLGKHNIQNILGCAALARRLGLTMDEIAAGIANQNGVTVIDDAFNSNPAGARAALEVIDTFPGRRIVVTPGLVELGEREAEENEAFGRAMAPVATVAILVARNARALEKGLLEAGFDKDNIIITRTLAQASAALGHLTQAGDVVLFENDLPDHYEM